MIRFVVQSAWFVGGVSVEGKTPSPPNRGQIATTAQLNLGVPFHDADVTNAVQNIQHLLEANGLYQAQVEPSVERDSSAQQVFVTFTIKVGKRAKYAEPVIQGQTLLSDATILRGRVGAFLSSIGGVTSPIRELEKACKGCSRNTRNRTACARRLKLRISITMHNTTAFNLTWTLIRARKSK